MTVGEHCSGPRADTAGRTAPRVGARGRLPLKPLELAATPVEPAAMRVDLTATRVDLAEAERLISDLAALVDAGLIVVRPNVLGPARYEVAA